MRTNFSLFGVCASVVIWSCSPEPGGSDTAAGDARADTVARDTADISEDTTAEPDTSDAHDLDTDDTTDSSDGSSGDDVRDAQDGGNGDSGGGAVAAGEPCPSDCQPTQITGSTRCESCEGNWCFTPPDGNGDPYCSRRCDNDTECEELGSEWYCNYRPDVCRNEGDG